jgi:hypothetical protein
MSTGDWFTLVPLSNFFVKKSDLPNPNTISIPPLSTGNVTASNISSGRFTWYQVFNFGGDPNNTQGVELKTYVLVVRGLITTTGVGNTDPIPLPQPFDNNFKVYKLFYNTMSTAQGNYTASVNSTGTGIIVNFAVIGSDA